MASYDINTEAGRRRLSSAVKKSREYLSPFRVNRHSHIQQYTGHFYSNNGTKKAVPKNIMDQFHTVMVMELATNNPAAMVLTKKRHLYGEAYAREFALNNEIKKLNLAFSNRAAVSETIFGGIGIIRVGLAEYPRRGNREATTQTFVSPVDFDDWVHDCSAPCWNDVEFEGNRYSVSREEALESGLYDKARIRKALESEYRTTDEYGNDRTSSITRDQDQAGGDGDYYIPQLNFVDLFFPRKKKICTFLASPASDSDWIVVGEPIREEEWDGPPSGPYHKLVFKDVPTNTMGKAMAGDIRSLHDAVNALLRKVARDAINSKSVFTYTGPAQGDAQRIQRTKDGDYIRLDHGPDAGKMIRFDATNPAHMGFVSYFGDQANQVGGNFNLLGGLGPQTETLGQDRLLHQSASRLVDDMQSRTEKFVRGIVEDVAWYLFDDPDLYREVDYPVPDTDISVRQPLTAESLQGNFEDFEFEIEVHSMRPKGPQERLAAMQTLMQTAQQFAAMGMLDQQQMTIDTKGYLEHMARLLGAEVEWKKMMITSDEPLAVGDRSHERSMPSETKRTYERVNRSGMTQPGYEQEFQKSMFSQGKNLPGEAA